MLSVNAYFVVQVLVKNELFLSGAIGKNVPQQNTSTSPGNPMVETTSIQVTKSGGQTEKHTIGVLGKQFFDNKVPLKRKVISRLGNQ